MTDLPSGDAFLSAILDRVDPCVRPGRMLSGQGTREFNVTAVATALLVQGALQARAARTILRSSNPESAIPNIRSLYECFGELQYLLTADDPRHEAVTAFAFAMKELEASAIGIDVEVAQHVAADRKKLAEAMPLAAAAADARRNYWTEVGRKELVERAVSSWAANGLYSARAGFGKDIYKIMSWDSHHVMASLARVDLIGESPTYGMLRKEHPWKNFAEIGAFLAGMALDSMVKIYRLRMPEC